LWGEQYDNAGISGTEKQQLGQERAQKCGGKNFLEEAKCMPTEFSAIG
jgi:hypothetical protein